MSWVLLVPATVIVGALIVLSVGMRAVERETVALRDALRRSAATAVATDELGRSAEQVRIRIERVQAAAKRRIPLRPRWWNQPPREHR